MRCWLAKVLHVSDLCCTMLDCTHLHKSGRNPSILSFFVRKGGKMVESVPLSLLHSSPSQTVCTFWSLNSTNFPKSLISSIPLFTSNLSLTVPFFWNNGEKFKFPYTSDLEVEKKSPVQQLVTHEWGNSPHDDTLSNVTEHGGLLPSHKVEM